MRWFNTDEFIAELEAEMDPRHKTREPEWPSCPLCSEVIEYNVPSPENEYVCPHCGVALKFEDRKLVFREVDQG